MNKVLKVIEGPTGVGKTALAIQWAEELGCEIISADSRQFYRELDIGVARPSKAELNRVPHHFIAFKSIQDYYSVSRFETDALNLLEELFKRHDYAVMVGGSGLYVNAVCHGIDEMPDPSPQLREEIKNLYETKGIEAIQEELLKRDPKFYEMVDLNNPMRLRRALEVCISTSRPYSELRTASIKERPFKIERYALLRPKEILYQRINQRVDLMLKEGLLEEVRALLPFSSLNALNTVGYKELFPYFSGEISLEQAVTDIKTHSRRYAKRQLTWLRKQKDIQWINLPA